ncbi:MAG TPA: AI-2E family transporter [Firmicutes bacterium]|nr:AI-2E family transporter [Bacillota bacterium]HOQ24526.1 AI-2E family transporter [Bacillota bacterium]
MQRAGLRRLLFPGFILFMLVTLYLFKEVIWPFLLAWLVALLLEPQIRWLEQKGAKRSWAVLSVFLVLLVVLGVGLLWLVPPFLRDLNRAAVSLPEYARRIQHALAKTGRLFQQLPPGLQSYVESSLSRSQEVFRQLLLRGAAVVIAAFSQTFRLLLVPFLAYYISRDLPEWRRQIRRRIPRWLGRDTIIFWRTMRVIGAYIRGQLLVSAAVGGIIMLGLLLLRIEMALLIGVMAGIFNLIPYFGPILGALPAVILGLLTSPWRALYVVLLFVVANQLETMFLMPRLVGRSVGLHPVVVIFLLVLGGHYLGLFGMLLAVPIGGVVKVVCEYYLTKGDFACFSSD